MADPNWPWRLSDGRPHAWDGESFGPIRSHRRAPGPMPEAMVEVIELPPHRTIALQMAVKKNA